MQENNRGIAYARNFILDMARESGVYWFWMLDDDVSRFVVGRDKKNHQLPINVALMECQKILGGIARTMPTLVQAALEYQQFTWSAAGNKQYRLNGYCDVCVAMNAKVIPPTARYRGFVNLKEDRDFTLQLLSDGYRTCRFSQIGFAAPKNGTNKGGLYDVYKNGTEATASRRMVEVWGDDICKTEIKPDGRPDVKINWKMFKNN